MLNKSQLHLNPPATKALVNNIYKVASQEFARLHTSRAFAPYVSSRLTCFRCLRAFVSYVTSRLRRLHVLRALLTGHNYGPCASLSRAFRTLFDHIKIVLGWICSPAKSYHFPRIIKGAL